MTYPQLLPQVREIARQAGERILEIYYGDDFGLETKADNSPLTRADRAAHDYILGQLPQLAPQWPILSEEAADIPYAKRRSWETYWLVDPLDGTREFIKRNDEFTVNIALIKQHKPVLGVVYAPVFQECYSAAEGVGSFKQSKDGSQTAIESRARVAEEFKVVGSRSHAGPLMQDFMACVQNNMDCPVELLSSGSSLKICRIAEGLADLYPRLGPTSEWDTAAAHCVVEQAGAQLTDLTLQPLRYNTKESLLNPHFLVFKEISRDWADCLPPQ